MDYENTATAAEEWIDLADRRNDGLEITLLWNRLTGRVKVTVDQVHTGRHGELEVPAEDAMVAFHHPFAYTMSSRKRTTARQLSTLELAPPKP
ncbi:MAG TPA: hypothetical protein VJT84_03150 [Gaiellaceae bacterium]|nr:hypothetical protein [Gaiellaceae bacterium]